MAMWKAQGGGESGTIVLSAGGTKSYLRETPIADPATITTEGNASNEYRIYTVGSDRDGNEVACHREIVSGSEQTFTLGDETPINLLRGTSGGATYPTGIQNLADPGTGGDEDKMYAPRAVIVHRGLAVVICSRSDYSSGTRSLVASWDQNNGLSVLWKNLGSPNWNVIDDDVNACAATLGALWMVGRPMIVGDDLYLGYTNYFEKNGGNDENRAYISKFTDSGSAWSHGGSAEILSDGSDPDDQHYHSPGLEWDGSRLLYILSVGDAEAENGLVELSRSNLDFVTGASAKSGFEMLDGTGDATWTNNGFVHGGNTDTNNGSATNGLYKNGIQTTALLPLDSRWYCPADVGSPGVYSFPAGRVAGATVSARNDYLDFPSGLDNNMPEWEGLCADCNDYESPTSAASLMPPSSGFSGFGGACRVAYYKSGRWFTAAQVTTTNTGGLGVSPNGSVLVGTTTGIRRIVPGGVSVYTPLVSSLGATNVIAGTSGDYVGAAIGGEVTASDVSGSVSLPTGAPSAANVLRFATAAGALGTVDTIAANVIPPAASRTIPDTVTDYQVRLFVRSLAGQGYKFGLQPRAYSGTGDGSFMLAGGATIGSNGRFETKTDDWTEVVWGFTRTEGFTGDHGAIFWFFCGTSGTSTEISETNFEVVIAGVYTDKAQRVLQNVEYGATASDTDLSAALPPSPFPLTVRGVTHPRDVGSDDTQDAPDVLLYRLYSAADTYIDFKRDLTNDRISITGELGGVAITAIDLRSGFKWTPETPIIIRTTRSGSDLVFQGSVYGNPLGSGTTDGGFATISGANNYDWDSLDWDDGTYQGAMQLAEISAEEGGMRSRNRSRIR